MGKYFCLHFIKIWNFRIETIFSLLSNKIWATISVVLFAYINRFRKSLRIQGQILKNYTLFDRVLWFKKLIIKVGPHRYHMVCFLKNGCTFRCSSFQIQKKIFVLFLKKKFKNFRKCWNERCLKKYKSSTSFWSFLGRSLISKSDCFLIVMKKAFCFKCVPRSCGLIFFLFSTQTISSPASFYRIFILIKFVFRYFICKYPYKN